MQFNYNNGYQNWKNTINIVLMYSYIKKQLEIENKILVNKIKSIQQSTNRDSKTQANYMKYIKQLFSNHNQIEQRLQQGLKNQQLLQKLYKEKGIDISYKRFTEWIKQGKRF